MVNQNVVWKFKIHEHDEIIKINGLSRERERESTGKSVENE